jgi:hypothetical protein
MATDFQGMEISTVGQPIVKGNYSHVDHGGYSSRVLQLLDFFQFFSLVAEMGDDLFHYVFSSFVRVLIALE